MSNFAGTKAVAESTDKNRTPLDPLTSYLDDTMKTLTQNTIPVVIRMKMIQRKKMKKT